MQQKAALVKKLENKSTREAQKIVVAIAPKGHDLLDRVKPVAKDTLSFQFVGDEALMDKIRKLKGLFAHSHPHISLSELFHKLCDLGLEEWQPHGAPKKRSGKERLAWERDHGRCTNCGSEHALEIDHIIPKAMGGGSEIENLRLLCRTCNQRAAIAKFGQAKMDKYLKQRKPG